MATPAIRIEGLGKRYSLVQNQDRSSYKTLRDSISKWASNPFGHGEKVEHFWALRDVTLDVCPGAVVGIIGRNGAGKSTLLKILSRITRPTTGRVEINGRVGSLLEVGTGFHPELTGKENIFLNGSILGMRRREIKSKFDEIVAFAEVEKFLNTPVKRYSSGMYVRLAFAVAAHLEPEILIVDEVLAVGDAGFQKKCLGKMHDVSRCGRTVLFVSHNLAAMQTLCTSGVHIAEGTVAHMGSIADSLESYRKSLPQSVGYDIDLADHPSRISGREPIIRRLRILNETLAGTDSIASGESLVLELHLSPGTPLAFPAFGIGVNDALGQRLFTVGTVHLAETFAAIEGPTIVRCEIPNLPLKGGTYSLTLAAGNSNDPTLDWLQDAATFSVVDADFFGTGQLVRGQGSFLVRSRWSTLPHDNTTDEVPKAYV